MSIPRNHHYVSQVLIRKFLDKDNNLYTYSKESGSIEEKKWSRFDFAEKDLNSTVDEFGQVEHSSVEEILNQHVETGFNNHYNKVMDAIFSNDFSELIESIKYLIRMGIIGDMRTPYRQAERQNIVLDSYRMISKRATKEIQDSLEEFESRTSDIKNKMPIDYKAIIDKTLDLMGETIYSVFEAPQSDFFFLPDCSSIVVRSQLEDDTIIDGIVFHNPTRPISTVILPINSKVVLVAQSKKICPQESHGIYKLSSNDVDEYNIMFLEKAHDKVICENKEYLNQFVSKYKCC